MQGKVQSADTALELFNLLSRPDTKLRQPVGLEIQLRHNARMDSDVSKSMLQLLQVCCYCLVTTAWFQRPVALCFRNLQHAFATFVAGVSNDKDNLKLASAAPNVLDCVFTHCIGLYKV